MAKKFNTRLNKKQKVSFDNVSATIPSLIGDRDYGAYDTQGFFKSLYKKHNGNENAIAEALTPGSPAEHVGVDTFKKPNHPTFSNESKYHIPLIRKGGHWKEEGYFNATKRNMKNLSNSEQGSALGYFQQAEDLDGDGIPNIGLKYKNKMLIPRQFQQGGLLPAGHGDLKPIGASEAYEVKGDNPAATDDVAVGDAFVDHNEVVKPVEDGLRIFSDTLKPPGSKLAFSKLAKQLEKQKTKDEARFPEQNQIIEIKLDKLFQVQQAMNGNNQGESPEEGMQPVNETPGEGFNQGNMFAQGGRLAPISIGQHQMKGINWAPQGKYAMPYHPITPRSFGKFSPIGFGSKVMAGAGVDISNQNISKMITGNLANPRGFQLGGQKTFNYAPGMQRVGDSTMVDRRTLNLERDNPILWHKLNHEIPGQRVDQVYSGSIYDKDGNIMKDQILSGVVLPRTTGVNPYGNRAIYTNKLDQDAATSRQAGTFVEGGFDPFKPAALDYGKMIAPKSKYFNPEKALMEGKFAAMNDTISANQAGRENLNAGKFNLNDGLAAAATLAPVFGNMAAARKLPPVADVYLNKPVNLKKLDYSDQFNTLKQGLRTASLAAGQNSVNPNAQQAGMGNAQAQFMNATNQMYGDINRQNTSIGNQEAMINTQIQGQNNMLMGQRSQSEQARASNMLGIQSGNRADLSNKTLGLVAQDNQKKLDAQKYKMFTEWLNKQGAGLGDRNPFLQGMAAKKGGLIPNKKLVKSK